MEREIKERIKIARWVAMRRLGILTAEEEKRLDAWVAGDEKHRALYERLLRMDILPRIPQDDEKRWQQFVRKYPVYPRVTRRRWATWLSAACCAALIAAGALLWPRPERTMEEIATPTPTDKVQVVLGDGESVILERNTPAEAARVTGATVRAETKTNDESPENVIPDTAMEYHTIIVPKYGEYTVRLADNTVVKLNSESTLRYPVAFRGATRDVWLTGEAYMEVARDTARRFRVHTGGTTVSVLGTVFNVASEADGRQTVTTLVSGSVEVDNGGESRVIRPGEQAVTRKDAAAVVVRPANIATATAWTRDMFYFDEEPLETIMRALAQWYEFRVVFENDALRGRRFTVESSRYGEIDDILRLIEETGVVACRKEGRAIYIR